MTRTRLTLAAMLVLFAATGCHTYRGDLETFCNAVELAKADGVNGTALDELAPWLAKNIHTRRGREFVRNVAMSADASVAREIVAEQGIESCPILEPITVTPTTPIDLPTPSEE